MIVTVLIHAALLGAYLVSQKGDVSAFVCVDAERLNSFPFEAIGRGFPTGGYDGQFYYALARSPWQRHTQDIDAPARHLRILYPALAWLLSGGDKFWLLWIMPALNLAVVGALAGMAAWHAGRHGLSPWWGMVLPFVCNVGIPMLRDLTDPVATLTVFSLLALWSIRCSALPLALCSTLALLSREPNLMVVLIMIGAAAWARRWGVVGGLGCALCFWACWVVVLRAAYGAWPFLPGSGNFTWPGQGLLHRWSLLQGNAGSRLSPLLQSAGLVCVMAEIVLAVRLIRPSKDAVVKAFLVVATLLAVMAGPSIYGDTWSYLRVLVWLPLGIWMASIQLRKMWPLWLLLPASLSTFLAVARGFAP